MEDWSLLDTVFKIGCGVLVASMIGAPVGAALFHDALITAAVKAGVATLIGQTAAETLNYKVKERKARSPQKVFDRSHDLFVKSIESYRSLKSSASSEEVEVARARLVMDGYAAALASLRFGTKHAAAYRDSVADLQRSLSEGSGDLHLNLRAARFNALAADVRLKHQREERSHRTQDVPGR